MKTNKQSQDWIILASAVWLLCSPWWLQYFLGRPFADQNAATWTSLIIGLTITFFAIRVLVLPEKWEERLNLGLGLLLLASPWALGFYSNTIAMVNMTVVGGVISISAAIGLLRLTFTQHHSWIQVSNRH